MIRIGIDIGGSGIKAVRLDKSGPKACARVAYTSPDIKELTSAITKAAREIGAISADTLGVCVPGILAPEQGKVVYAANLPCLNGINVGQLAAEACGTDAADIVLTDAAAAGLGSWKQRPVQGRLLTLAMGTGVGAALIEKGRLLTIDGATSGHVGQMDVSFGEPFPPVGPDGGRGSLEAYVGWPALVSRFGEEKAASCISQLDPEDPAFKAMVRMIRICHAIYKPSTIRLVGGVGTLFEPLVRLLHEAADDGLTCVADANWRLETMDDPYVAASGAAWGSFPE